MEIEQHHTTPDLRPQTLAFFDLPRELRDEIYKHYHHAIPRTSGVLRGYTDIPSSALLRTSSQVHSEAAPLFHRGLKAALLHERVCIPLRDKDAEGLVRHAGWTRVSHDRFDIWIRPGPEDDSEVGWLYDVRHIWQGGVQEATAGQVRDDVVLLSAKLKKLSHIFCVEDRSGQIGRRLYSVYSRVAQVAAKVVLMVEDGEHCVGEEGEEVKGSLKERQSQPNGLVIDMQQVITAVRGIQMTVYPPSPDSEIGGWD